MKGLWICALCALFLCFLSISDFGFAQNPRLEFNILPALSDISNSKTTTVIEDSMGYLWIGTKDGLFRFDGQKVFSYYQDVNDSTSLPSSGITRLILDKDDNLWISTYSGICRYNREFDNFSKIPDKSDLKGFADKNIQVIAFDNSGRLFAVFERTIYEYLNPEGKFSKVLELDHGQINDLIFDDQNNIWIAASMNGGLFCFDQEKKQLTAYLNDPTNTQSVSMNEIGDLALTDGMLWIGTLGKGIDTYNLKNKSFKHYSSSNNLGNYVNSIFISKGKKVWVCTFDCLKLFDAVSSTFYDCYFTDDNPKSVGKNLSGFYEDHQGNYWTFQSNGGVRVAKHNSGFNNFEGNQANIRSLSEKIITAITFDGSDRLWIGNFYNGIDIFSPKDQRIIRLQHDVNNPKSIAEGEIYSIFCDSKKQMWVGSGIGGLQKYRPGTNDFESYRHNPEDSLSIASNDIRSISEDLNGDLWLLVMGKGVDRFDIRTKTFHHYNSKNNRLSNDYTFQVLNDSRGNLWVASWGLGFLAKGQRIFKNFYYSKSDDASISSDDINTVYEDGKHNIWIGTANGLNKFNYETQTFAHYSNGLKNSHINSIISDKKNNIWVGTNDGISKFDISTKEFTNYNQNFGLLSKQFIDRSCCKDKQNQLYFGGTEGIDAFNPDSVKKETRKPTVVLTDLKLFNKSITFKNYSHIIDRHISYAKKIVLNYSDHSISILFQAINITEADKMIYAYKLDGFEPDWQYVGKKREANYTNLSPGKYTFRVKAKFENGEWNDKDTSIELNVIPAWWMTIWFKIMMGLIILTSLFAIVFIRNRQLRNQKNKLEMVVAARTSEIQSKNELLNNLNSTKDRLFSIISHDIRGPFSFILGFLEMLVRHYDSYSEDERKKMISQTHSASRMIFNLVENLLGWAKIQTKSIQHNPVQFNVHEFFVQECELYQNLAEAKGIKFELQPADGLIAFADINLLKTVLRNLLNNAIKFTPEDGNIQIKAIKSNQSIEVSVTDSGIGMTMKQVDSLFDLEKTYTSSGTKGEKGAGLGLVLCKEFVEKNKGVISVESKVGNGSTFRFTIPAASEKILKT